MAAVAVQAVASGRPSKRKSRRALAQSFLSNISLDGNITNEGTGSLSEPNTPLRQRQRILEDDELEVATSTSDTSRPLQELSINTSSKPKYMHSISESAASFEKDKLRTLNSLGSKDMRTLKTPDTGPCRRSHSMTDSTLTECSSSSSFSGFLHYGKGASRHKITCMSGSSFRLRRKLTDKRYS